jgi:hypothetical protein
MAILGYPSSWRAPFSAVELTFGQGPSTASAGPRSALYVAPKTTAGTGTVNLVYPILKEQDAIDVAGAGSPAHRACRRHLLANKDGKLFLMVYAASSGSGVATATGTITLTFTSGSNPTATGVLTTTICGEQITTGFTTASTLTTIAAALAEQINFKTHLPVTASASVGVVTLTAKVAGASQGDGTVGVIRFRSIPDPGKNLVAATSGNALGLGTGTPGADGATTETANLTTALNGLTNSRYYYMGFTVWSSTALAPIKTHISNKSEPNPGLRSRGFTAYTGTLTALQTLAISANHERRHFVHQEASEWDAADLVGNAMAVHQKAESVTGGFVHDNYRDADWMCPAVYDPSDRPTGTEINDSVTDGIIQIASDEFGSFMVMSVNSRSKDSGGTLDDFRATETHRVSFMDYVADTWLLRDGVQYGTGFKLQADQLRPDGTVNFNQFVPARTLTPSLYKPFPASLISEFVRDGLLQDEASWLASLRCYIDPLNSGRLGASASGRTIDIRHQLEVRLVETSPG